MTGTEEKRTAEWSPDAIGLDSSDSDEPEVIEEIKTEEFTESKKIAETGKEESEVVEEVPVAVEVEETAMEAETTSSVEAPEVATSAAITPMDTSTASEPQPSSAILDQSSVNSLIPSTLEHTLQLSYPLDSRSD